MAYVPDIKQPGYAPAWQNKKADQQHDFQTMDGAEYIVYVPSSNQLKAYEKSLREKYKDVFDQIKADIKDDATIAKNRDGLPNELDHVEWAALLSSIFKKLDKTWGVNDKIWIRNKNDDGTKSQPPVLAITPKMTQRNAKRGAQKVSAATAAGSEFIIDPKNVTFGPSLPPITQYAYVVTKIDGLTYYYHTEKDVDKDNHFMIENAKGEQVDKNGEIFDPGEDFRRFVEEGQKDEPPAPSRAKSAAYPSDDESEDDYQYESDNERNDFDYNDGIPPYEGARWDYDLEGWVSDPMDPEIYDEEGNYRILPEDIIDEPEPALMLAPPPAPAPIKPQESRRDLLKKRENARRLAKNPQPDVVMPPPTPMPMPALAPAPTEAERIAEARIGLPAGWEPLISRGTNMIYYYNQTNGNKQYEVPAEDPRIVEARIGLPSPWEAYISTKYNRVYYIDTSKGEVDNKGQWERPTIGGKRTRRRPRPKSRAKKPKKKRTTKRRKRTTTTTTTRRR